MDPQTALVIDDDPEFRESMAKLVEHEGFQVRQAASLAETRSLLARVSPDLVLMDLALPDGEGLELARDEAVGQGTAFVVVTGQGSVDTAVESLQKGALDYLTKPVDRRRLTTVLAHVRRQTVLRREVASLREDLRELGRFGPLIGRAKPMQEVYDLVARVAPTEATVFITGQSGTGMELVAHTVHELSRRRDQPMVAVNCGAVTPTLIESELFGHERGSFTGAERRHIGLFERANGGTVFLDEITEMPIELQVKLLRVLENRTLNRVGSTEPIPVDVRVIAASNREPKAAVEEGTLREDLLYRLNVFPIDLPPLRERGMDVILLAEHFLSEVNRRESSDKRFSESAHQRLLELGWPGNVRELRNAVERAAILADRAIGPEDLPPLDAVASTQAPGSSAVLRVEVGASIAEVERRLILATLDQLSGDKKRAAEILGISLKTLYTRLGVYSAAANGHL
ncbi:MAG TPA: sigma-54 dependent transcriptional regulator [Myxococcota bacterium]|nr:sigma-54 dependent transcriptional regulator [Myxococcota bacterium]